MLEQVLYYEDDIGQSVVFKLMSILQRCRICGGYDGVEESVCGGGSRKRNMASQAFDSFVARRHSCTSTNGECQHSLWIAVNLFATYSMHV